MPAERRAVEVCADWLGLGGPVPMGTLFATPSRGKDVFSFVYARDWLDRGRAMSLDPALRLVAGPQYVRSEHDTFGVFLDSAPDRWGRVLMQRREAQLARDARRSPRRLTELDYLIGVYDGHRLGALRFRIGDGPFLDDDDDLAAPPWTTLRELEAASLHLEEPDAERDPSYSRWLRMLIAPGRSLGGARPKASVIDPSGRLWIAKFPSKDDDHDVGGWEGVASSLARRAGVNAAETQRHTFASRHQTLLARRFDRTDAGARIHFASAMTMLERSDGEAGASYLDLAAVLAMHGAHPARDLEELWRRIVFFICISNVDDHLRNHGFLLEDHGWSLAPAYDMNPSPTGGGLTLNIDETDNAQDLELVRSVAAQFRVKRKRAEEIIATVMAAVRTWRTEAKSAGIGRAEQERMADAFAVAEA